ncbi:hypothetical protein DLM78_20580 [Leptospira stimsonii]|uniref:Uncharacterized protein n=1 Tax=Leptospira stimsonii TaxID=2202203 RepID=A0A8B3CMN6_9LEPT|nr:hypothetical protein DLM78_20580 [Leptospira stimsonii]
MFGMIPKIVARGKESGILLSYKERPILRNGFSHLLKSLIYNFFPDIFQIGGVDQVSKKLIFF